MPALWLRSLTIICLARVARSSLDKGGVVWREVGGFITITCRPRVPDQDFLNIKLGLLSKDDILSTGKNMEAIISKEFRDRLDFNVVFPNVSITIKNLTVNDTGAYWCTYIKTAKKTVEENGSGSAVLVVQEKEQCAPQNTHLGLGPAMLGLLLGSAILLLFVIVGFLVCIIDKTKTKKTTRATANDVYEDMRGTLRR